MLEKTLESPLDGKEIQPVHPKAEYHYSDCGLNSTWSYTYTINDTEKPSIQSASDTTMSIVACDTVNFLSTPTAIDECGVEKLYYSIDGEEFIEYQGSASHNFPIGTTEVKWYATDPTGNISDTCVQKVTVVDVKAPTPICDLDTIRVKITENSTYFDSITYQEAVEAGLKAPTYEDECDGTIVAEGSRKDNQPMESIYPLGETIINWTYTDKAGNSSQCPQVLIVEGWTIEPLTCPGTLDGKVFSCIDDIPEAYKTFDEFKANGGYIPNERKIILDSFRSEDIHNNDSCNMTVTRIYHVTDLRGNDITCEETVSVRDTIAPIFDRALQDTVLSCTDTIFDIISINATDNCDPSPIIEIKETNNRNLDAEDYAYYNYEIVRTYIAKDRCGNTREQRQMILVRDTISPKLDVPSDWDEYDLADLEGHCTFKIPSYAEKVKAFASDNCSESLTIVQVPAAGTIVSEPTDVMIYVYDVTGNVDSLSKKVFVQYAKEIAKLYATNVDSCITDDQGISLASQKIRSASGSLVIIDDWTHEKVIINSTFAYEYYRGKEPKVENLMFSDNEKTYWHLFEDVASIFGSSDKAAAELTKLTQRSESGYYTMVVTDTTSGCSDTATIFVNIKERPKISLESTVVSICEKNQVDLDPYINCIDNMGADSLKTYWKKDDLLFDFKDSVRGLISYNDNNLSAVLYAENECGTSSSLNTHLAFCNNTGFQMTTEDSLAFLDNDSIALELLRANLLFSRDSILFDVHKRYKPEEIFIQTDPNDPARIWFGESISLSAETRYDYKQLTWYKVVGDYDMKEFNSATEHEEFVFNNWDDRPDQVLSVIDRGESTEISDSPIDTSYYYVTITDGVCPSVPSGLTRVAVLDGIPTAFTPHTKDGLNDVFMKHHHVVIFDRYGQKVFEGDNGWDGSFRGGIADPGVYFHQVRMGNGTYVTGTIEIIKIK